jgi:hypothetical protein
MRFFVEKNQLVSKENMVGHTTTLRATTPLKQHENPNANAEYERARDDLSNIKKRYSQSLSKYQSEKSKFDSARLAHSKAANESNRSTDGETSRDPQQSSAASRFYFDENRDGRPDQ